MEYLKLDPAFKTKYLAALRSGEYKQGHMMLYNKKTDSYCCLGVAAVISGVPKEHIAGLPLLFIDTMSGFTKEEVERCPAALVVDWNHPHNAPASAKLSLMNDGAKWAGKERKTFSEIADWIEENL